MFTITLSEGIRLTASAATLDRYYADCARIERERAERAEHARLVAWLSDPANYGDELYSDIYKDVYGVRPRW